jgi:hypothetical protein
MAQNFNRVEGQERVRPPVIAKNSEAFTVGLPVTIDANGFLAVSTAGDKIWGYVTETVTVLSTNQNGSTQTLSSAAIGYAPRVIDAANVYIWADSDQAMTQTDIGAYVDIGSTTSGSLVLNLAAGATGQFLVCALASDTDPTAEGDTDRIVVKVAEPQDYAFAQS